MDQDPKVNPFASGGSTIDDVKPVLNTQPTPVATPMFTSPVTPATTAPVATPATVLNPYQPSKQKRTSLNIALVILGVILLAGIGFAVWFFAYYNSNGVVMRDAFHNIAMRTSDNIEFDGAITSDSDNSKGSIKGFSKYDSDKAMTTLDGQIESNGISLKAGLDLTAKADGSELYFRVRTPEAIDQMIAQSDQSGMAKALTQQLTDKWLSFKISDLTDMYKQMAIATDDSNKQIEAIKDYQKCLLNNNKKLQSDKAVRSDLLKAIQDAKAFKIERSKDSNGQKFVITLDSNKIKTLVKNVQKSQYVKLTNDCTTKLAKATDQEMSNSNLDKSVDEAADSLKKLIDETKPKLTFWVTTWGHQPTKAALSMTTKSGDATVNMDFTAKSTGKKSNIELPKGATPITNVLQQYATTYIQTLQQQQLQQSLGRQQYQMNSEPSLLDDYSGYNQTL